MLSTCSRELREGVLAATALSHLRPFFLSFLELTPTLFEGKPLGIFVGSYIQQG